MLAIAIIVFREVLEASLIVGIVLAASVGIPRRGRWVAGGIVGGVLGAGAVAAFAASIAGAFQGNGQELLNATVLCLAVCMLGWHNIWMARHARETAANASSIGRQVASGAKPLAALALITGAAVLREGSETVLFVFGIVAGTQTGLAGVLGGGLLGLAGGAASGAAIYFGPAAHPAAPAVPGHQLDGAAARRWTGVAGGGLSGAGQPAAATGQRDLGYLLAAVGGQHSRPCAAHADRLRGAAGGHPAGRLRPDPAGDRRADEADRPSAPRRDGDGGAARRLACSGTPPTGACRAARVHAHRRIPRTGVRA